MFNEFCGRCLISSVAKALALAYALKKVRKSQSKCKGEDRRE